MRAMELFAEVAAAVPAAGAIDFYPEPIERPRITVRTGARQPAARHRRSPTTEIRDLLAPLGIETEGAGDDFIAIAPTFRPDLEREIDIVEEVGRRVGLAEHPAHGAVEPGEDRRAHAARSASAARIADVLVGAGYDEAYTLPLLAPADLARAGFAHRRGRSRSRTRCAPRSRCCGPRCCPGCLRAVAFNAAHGTPDVVAVRTRLRVRAAGRRRDAAGRDGCTWPPCAPDGVRRAPARTGSRPSHAYDAVAVVEAIAEELRLARLATRSRGDAPGFHPVRTAAVVVDGTRVGCRR